MAKIAWDALASLSATALCRSRLCQRFRAATVRERSEVKLERELDLAHIACPGNLTETASGGWTRAVAPACVGIVQYHMVRSVEHLRAELQVLTFSDREMLEDRKILGPSPRSPQVVARTAPERGGCRVGECRRIIPAVLVGIGHHRVHASDTVEPGGIGNEIGAPGIP